MKNVWYWVGYYCKPFATLTKNSLYRWNENFTFMLLNTWPWFLKLHSTYSVSAALMHSCMLLGISQMIFSIFHYVILYSIQLPSRPGLLYVNVIHIHSFKFLDEAAIGYYTWPVGRSMLLDTCIYRIELLNLPVYTCFDRLARSVIETFRAVRLILMLQRFCQFACIAFTTLH